MYGTHCKHCLLIPPLVFNNNLALLICGYMCVGTLVHISRHLGKTSNNNNNKRCQLWIRCMLCRVCFYRVLHRISDFMIIIILAVHTLLYHSYSIPPVSCSYLIIPWVLPAWYRLSYIYLLRMLMLTTQFSMYDYDSVLSIHVLIFARHLAFASPLAWGVLTPLDPHVQVLELGACGLS